MEGIYNVQSLEGLREVIADLAIQLADTRRKLSIEQDYAESLQQELAYLKGGARNG